MGWTDLAKADGREIDQFDDKYAVHLLYIEQGEVVGYQRMLPSTRPHLLTHVMPQLCEGDPPSGPHIWECTRHCVAKSRREKGRVASPISNTILSGMVEWGIANGVSTAIVEIEPSALLRFIQLHFRPLPLGLPQKIDGKDVIAVTLNFDWRTLERLHELRGDDRRALIPTQKRPALLHS